MNINKQISKLINKRKDIHPDDPVINEIWKEIVNILKDDEEGTISFLKQSEKEELYWLSEIFEELSSELQSKKYIKCLLELQEKYPDIEMEEDIKYAIQSLDANE